MAKIDKNNIDSSGSDAQNVTPPDSLKHESKDETKNKPKQNALSKIANNNKVNPKSSVKDVAKDSANKAAKEIGKAAAVKGGAVAGYASLASLFVGALHTAGVAVVNAIASMMGSLINMVVGAISSFISATVAIATTTLTGLMGVLSAVAMVVSIPIIMFTADQMTQSARIDDKIMACNTDNLNDKAAALMSTGAGESLSDISEEEIKENVEKTNSVIKSYKSGVTDEQISGIVGPWFAESGIQPKRYESDYIFKNKYDLLDEKGPTAEVLSGGWGPFAAKYSISLNESGYMHEGKHYIGVGLGQWTGIRAKLLWDFSKKIKSSMFEMDTQLSYMVGPDPGRDRLDQYLAESKGMTADEASTLFLKVWEGVEGNKKEMRAEAALKWLVKIKKMKVDKDYAKSILSDANVKMASSNSSVSDQNQKIEECDAETGETDAAGGIVVGDIAHQFNVPYTVAQPYGRTPFSINNPMYPMGHHSGIDLQGQGYESKDVPMFSATSGTVTSVAPDHMKGWYFMVKPDKGVGSNPTIYYGHMKKVTVKVGDKLKPGQRIGIMGDANGVYHVHFEYNKNASTIGAANSQDMDPKDLIPTKTKLTQNAVVNPKGD